MTDPEPPRDADPSPNDPWNDLEKLFDDVRARVSRGWAAAFPSGSPPDTKSGEPYRPATADVTDTGPSFKIVAEVPGIPKDRIDVRVRGTRVEIRGEKVADVTAKSGGEVVRRERTYAGFYRQIDLPSPVAASGAHAKVENGILELEIPKLNPASPPQEVRVAIQ